VSAGTGERFTIELPADPAYVATARMFASELARQVGVPVEMLDDVKVAVSEACAGALRSAERKDHLKVRVHRSGRLAFEVPQGEITPKPGASSTDDLTAALSLELITVLFEDGEATRDDDGKPVIRFSAPIS